MELKNVITFLRAAELQNFTRVAEELGYAPSTITVQIQQLESDLGFQLFDRIRGRVFLTDLGQQFIPFAYEMATISKKVMLLGKEPMQIKGSLRIGILESLFTYILLPLLPQYIAEFPNVTIEFKTSSTTILFDMLRRNEVDIIFTLDKKIMEKDCVSVYSNPETLVFVTSPNHPIAGSHDVQLKTILEQQLILTERVGLYRRTLEDLAATQKLLVKPHMEVDNTDVIISLLKQGLGVSFLPKYTVRSDVSKGTLAIIDADVQPMRFWIQLFYHKNKWVSPQMKGLISLICRSLDLNDR